MLLEQLVDGNRALQRFALAGRAMQLGQRIDPERLAIHLLARTQRFAVGGDRPEKPAVLLVPEMIDEIRAGLAAADRAPAPELDAESIEELRALGYLD